MDCKHATALLRIRQACSLGLPSRSVMPIVMRELRALIPAACAQFTWASETGRLTNFWSDTFMPRRMAWIVLHRARYEADAGTSFRDLVLFGRPTGNLRRWWREGFEHSATYRAVFEPFGFKWLLDGVVRDAQRPYGCVALIRRRDAPDFSAAEEALLARVLPYLLHALRTDTARPSRFVRTGRSAMLVCSTEGEPIEWSDEAHRLAVYALLDEINTDAQIGGGDFERVREGLREIALALGRRLDDPRVDAPLPLIERRNGWGEFSFRGYRLHGEGADRIGLLIEQSVPVEARLLERVNAIDLSPRQKEIALLSARGLCNAEIADRLGLSPHTLKDHFKAIYARLAINSQRELAALLMSDAQANPPRRWDAAQPSEA